MIARVSQTVALLCIQAVLAQQRLVDNAVGHPFGLACGHSDPEINRQANAGVIQTPQQYETGGRRLSSFVSVHNATDVIPIRIEVRSRVVSLAS